MNINNKPVTSGVRLATMLLDHIFMTIIFMVFFIPSFIVGFSEAFKVTHEQRDPGLIEGPAQYLVIFGLALYLCRDVFNGRSLAKRILKLQVVDNATGQVASPLKCFIRNIFCIIWPVEVIVALINPKRRLGDRVAGTKLVPFNPALQQPKINFGGTALSLILSYGLMFFISQLLPGMESSLKFHYVETSYNSAESKALEQLFTKRMGNLVTPDIRVYDSIENEKLKYISVILKLKQDFIADDDTYSPVHNIAVNLVYSKFPKETFTGRMKYVYQSNGQFQSRTTTIGTDLWARR